MLMRISIEVNTTQDIRAVEAFSEGLSRLFRAVSCEKLAGDVAPEKSKHHFDAIFEDIPPRTPSVHPINYGSEIGNSEIGSRVPVVVCLTPVRTVYTSVTEARIWFRRILRRYPTTLPIIGKLAVLRQHKAIASTVCACMGITKDDLLHLSTSRECTRPYLIQAWKEAMEGQVPEDLDTEELRETEELEKLADETREACDDANVGGVRVDRTVKTTVNIGELTGKIRQFLARNGVNDSELVVRRVATRIARNFKNLDKFAGYYELSHRDVRSEEQDQFYAALVASFNGINPRSKGLVRQAIIDVMTYLRVELEIPVQTVDALFQFVRTSHVNCIKYRYGKTKELTDCVDKVSKLLS